MSKSIFEEHDNAFQYSYDGWSITIPKDQVKNQAAAKKIAEEQYKIWQDETAKSSQVSNS